MSEDKIISLHGPHDRYMAWKSYGGECTIKLKPEFFKMPWDDQMMDMRRVIHLLDTGIEPPIPGGTHDDRPNIEKKDNE